MLEKFITVDFSRKMGRIKPLSGVVLGPLFDTERAIDLTEEYSAMHLPVVRTRGAEMPRGSLGFLDICRIFPDPMLDERLPESYDFSYTDRYLSAIKASGAAILLSLGESIPEHPLRYPAPHVGAEKWARIAEKIILRYTKGWAGGPKLGVKMIEIWPGADRFGFARAEDFYSFYRTVACHLRSVFPTLKIGGYSSGGFASLNHYNATPRERGYLSFLEGFLRYITSPETAAPLDLFTWECHAESAEELALHANYAKNHLMQYGLRRTQSVVSSFRFASSEGIKYSREYPALLSSALISAEESSIDMMLYDNLHPYSPHNAVFTVDDCTSLHRYAAWGVMEAFGRLLSMGTEVYTTDNYRRELYTLGAISASGEGALLLATGGYSGRINLTVIGGFTSYSVKGMLGGGTRGRGYSTSEESIPLDGSLSVKVGKHEVYLFLFRP